MRYKVWAVLLCVVLLVTVFTINVASVCKDQDKGRNTTIGGSTSLQQEDMLSHKIDGQVSYVDKVSAIIPTIDEIMHTGYPKNNRGETYGPDIKESDDLPDLLLVKNESGLIGYIRVSEIDENCPATLEELQSYTPISKINMYLEDGVTIIGEFRFQNN